METNIFSQDLPVIVSSNVEVNETGLKLKFEFSSYIERADISSWIEQENWFILNFYNIIMPQSEFFEGMINYPIENIQQNWSQNSLQLSFQINRDIGMFDVLLDNRNQSLDIILTYSDYVKEKEVNPSFVFPDLKDAQKIAHPKSWKDSRENHIRDYV